MPIRMTPPSGDEITTNTINGRTYTAGRGRDIPVVPADVLALVAYGWTPAGVSVYNLRPDSLPRWRARLARALSGGALARYLAAGDSLTVGRGSGTGTNQMTGAFDKSPPAYLAKLFAREGWAVSYNAVAFDSVNPNAGVANSALYNPRMAFAGSGWTRGAEMFLNASTTDELTFTPDIQTDTIRICTIAGSTGGWGDFIVKDNATPIQTVTNTTGSQRMLVTTLTRTKSANPWKICKAAADANKLQIQWIETYDSTATQVSVINAGLHGYASAGWNSSASPWDKRNVFATLQPDLVNLALGTNDVRSNVSAATYETQMQAIIDAIKATGADVILTRYPPDNAPVNPGLLPDYFAVQYSLADKNDLPLIDLTTRLKDWTTSNANGLEADDVHKLAPGSAVMASAFYEAARAR